VGPGYAWRRHGRHGLLSPPSTETTKAWDFFRPFFVPKPRSYLDKDDAHRFQLDNKYDFVSELLTYSLQEMYDRDSE
jgi:hypothetical protein